MPFNKNVLHVDDDPAITRLVARRLNERGIEVTSINDPYQTIETLLKNNHRIVILDLSMPGIDGLELLKEIKAFDGGIHVIVLTGIVSMGNVLQAQRRGADTCFFKPLVSIEPLVTAINHAFDDIVHWWNILRELSSLRRISDTSGSYGKPGESDWESLPSCCTTPVAN